MYFFTLLLLVVLAHLTGASAELNVHADLRLDLSFESQCTISG